MYRTSERCSACARWVCGRQQVISKVLGGERALLCLGCLAESLGSEPDKICSLVGSYLARRECYRQDWQAAAVCDNDGQAPCCPSRLEHAEAPPAWYRREVFERSEPREVPEAAVTVDAEEAGCGDLMVLLMRSIRQVQPGQVLSLTARDPGAGADIPSWCRLTGHTLLAQGGPDEATYYIQRKEL
ncbi:MAG: sulfurtransferase TusA family protein [Actinomycetota bacterium]